MDNNASIVAIAAVLSALITLISNWLIPRGKVSTIKAEGDTHVRRTAAETEAAATKEINRILRKCQNDLDECNRRHLEFQRSLLANNKSIMSFLETLAVMVETQTAALERLIAILSKGTSP